MKQINWRLHCLLVSTMLFPFFTVLWEYGTVKLSVWIWRELFTTRANMGDVEAFFNILLVLGETVFVLPCFIWLPVLLYKELLYFHQPFDASDDSQATQHRFDISNEGTGERT